MEQEIRFENTTRVLEEFAEEVAESYRNKLVAHDHYASGNLWRSVHTKPIIVNNGRITVELEMAWYWKIIEEGLKPAGFYKNPGNFSGVFAGLLNWLKVKPTLPTHSYDDKLPNGTKLKPVDSEQQLKSMAAAMAHSLIKKGTEGTHLLRESVEETRSAFESAIVDALNQDIEDGLNIAMGWLTGGLS